MKSNPNQYLFMAERHKLETYKYFVNECIALFRVLSHPWKTKALKANSHAKWLANLVYTIASMHFCLFISCKEVGKFGLYYCIQAFFIYLFIQRVTMVQLVKISQVLVWRYMTIESLGLQDHLYLRRK